MFNSKLTYLLKHVYVVVLAPKAYSSAVNEAKQAWTGMKGEKSR